MDLYEDQAAACLLVAVETLKVRKGERVGRKWKCMYVRLANKKKNIRMHEKLKNKTKKLTLYLRVTLDENTNQSQCKCVDIAIYLLHSHDSRGAFVRVLHDVCLNIIQFNIPAI